MWDDREDKIESKFNLLNSYPNFYKFNKYKSNFAIEINP